MKKLMLLFCAVLTSVFASAAKYEIPTYDIEAAGSGVQGTYLVRVWVESKNGKVADDVLKLAAIHGVIFRGFAGTTSGAPTARPMCSPTEEQTKAEYFTALFNGPYAAFATVVTGSYQRVKASKKYKVGAIVQVQKDELRRELEKSGIVKGLNSGF